MHEHRAAPGAPSTTWAACLLLVVLWVAATAWLTHGFEAWTYEEGRRRDAAAGALLAPAMVLRDAQGTVRTVFDGGGDTVLLNFVYTRCTSVCQVQGSEFLRMQQMLREAGSPQVRLLSVSIDPVHDDVAALAAHARLHRADAALWAITAPLSPLQGRAALRQLGVVAVPDGLGGYVHNGSLHLVDRSGRVRRIFDDAAWPQALAAARALAGRTPP